MIIVHTLCDCLSANVLSTVESIVNIIVAVIGGVCAVKGIRYIVTLRKKRLYGTFSFCIQLRVRIEELYQELQTTPSVINGLYSGEVRLLWERCGTPATDKAVERFYANSQETLHFIKTVSDQIPANKAWLDAYMKFIGFLIDVIQYDIRDETCSFKFVHSEKLEDRDKYVKDICETMASLLKEIAQQQSDVAEEL